VVTAELPLLILLMLSVLFVMPVIIMGLVTLWKVKLYIFEFDALDIEG
jgi:hypothetical protein